MEENNNPSKEWKIPFEDNNFLLTEEYINQFAPKYFLDSYTWRGPTLKFISYKKGILSLLNSYENTSYILILKVTGNNLLVRCGCGSKENNFCIHSFYAFKTLISRQGRCYFRKLLPNGSFDLAFSHTAFFDKKESPDGINVFPRPELKSVFHLKNKANTADLQGILNVPVDIPEEFISGSGHTLAYLVLVPYCKVILPAVLPCVGQVTKDGSNIKSWTDYLHKTNNKFDELITESNQVLVDGCKKLWERVTDGHIPREWYKTNRSIETISKAFDLWNSLYPTLRKQAHVYAYKFFGVAETKRKPLKKTALKLFLSEQKPLIRFVLKEKGPYYEFKIQFWLEDAAEPIWEYEYLTQYFIISGDVMYKIAELRDALIIDWMLDTGGWITVFKEHYDQFMEEVINPLQGKYPILIIKQSKDKKKLQTA